MLKSVFASLSERSSSSQAASLGKSTCLSLIQPRPVNIYWASAVPSTDLMLRRALPELQLVSRHYLLNLEIFGFEFAVDLSPLFPIHL